MARVFQALRIEVNKEMEVLRSLLEQSFDVLKPEGRLVVLTYHSLEDRLVKNYFRSGNFEGKLLAWVGMQTAQGDFVPWLASQSDMLADDWAIVE